MGPAVHGAAGRGRPPLPAHCRRSLVRGLLDQPERATERLPSLPWRGEYAELLHEPKQVTFDPLFHDLAVGDPVDVGAGNARLLPCCWNTLERTGVLEPIGIVDDHHVVLRHEEFGRVVDIESSEVGGDQLLECLAASDWSRDT